MDPQLKQYLLVFMINLLYFQNRKISSGAFLGLAVVAGFGFCIIIDCRSKH